MRRALMLLLAAPRMPHVPTHRSAGSRHLPEETRAKHQLLLSLQVVTLAQMSLFTLLRTHAGLYRSFGFRVGQQPVFAALLMFQELIGPVDEVRSSAYCTCQMPLAFTGDAFDRPAASLLCLSVVPILFVPVIEAGGTFGRMMQV
jgi:hypothetical protein